MRKYSRAWTPRQTGIQKDIARGGNVHWEDDLQTTVVRYIRLAYPFVRFTISPANIKLTMYMAVKVKSLGYSKGTPDLIIPLRNKYYSGLWIELKSEAAKYIDNDGVTQRHSAGQLKPEQVEWINYLTKQGYRATCCKGFNEAKAEIDTYLRGVTWQKK